MVRRVKLHYSAFDMEGNIFDSSLGGEPLVLEVGSHILPKVVEDDLAHLSVGQELTKLVQLDPGIDHPLAGQEVIYEIKLVQIISS